MLLIALCVTLAAAALVFTSSTVTAVLLGAAIPEVQDVTGGHLGLHVAASDVVLALIGVQLLVGGVVLHRRTGILRALRPVMIAAGQYGWLVLVLLALHLGLESGIKSFQRLELFALPLAARRVSGAPA